MTAKDILMELQVCGVTYGNRTNSVIQGMVRQLQTLPHSTLFGLGNAPSAKFAERFIKIARGMHKIFYSDNGSTAIEDDYEDGTSVLA